MEDIRFHELVDKKNIYEEPDCWDEGKEEALYTEIRHGIGSMIARAGEELRSLEYQTRLIRVHLNAIDQVILRLVLMFDELHGEYHLSDLSDSSW